MENLVCCAPVDPEADPYFSKAACDYCGSHLAGNRYDIVGHAGGTTGPVYELSVCVDCFLALC